MIVILNESHIVKHCIEINYIHHSKNVTIKLAKFNGLI